MAATMKCGNHKKCVGGGLCLDSVPLELQFEPHSQEYGQIPVWAHNESEVGFGVGKTTQNGPKQPMVRPMLGLPWSKAFPWHLSVVMEGRFNPVGRDRGVVPISGRFWLDLAHFCSVEQLGPF